MDSNRILDKLDKIQEEISAIKVTLAKQHESIDYHIRRTDLLEESVEKLRTDFKPVQNHVNAIGGLGKLLAVGSALAAILTFILRLMQ